MQRRNSPAEKPTHPSPSPSPLRRQSFTQLVPAKKNVPVLFLSSFLLPLILFSLSSTSINVKMRQNVAILYLHPHSVLIPSLYPQPFRSYTSLTPLIASLCRSACLPASLLTSSLTPPKALSSPRYHPPVSVASIHPPFHLCRVYGTKQIPSLKAMQASASRVEG